MSQSTGGRRARSVQLRYLPAAILRLAKRPPASLSRQALARLRWIDIYLNNGRQVTRTCQRCGISRPTLYRWLRRYRPYDLGQLEDRSSAPRRRRRPTWTVEQREAVRLLRERYPRWGKGKLTVLLRREGVVLSESMVGRILTELRRTGRLREPRGVVARRTRRLRRIYAIRKPRDYAVRRPGDLVQLDTLDLRPVPGSDYFKHFSLIDLVSRWSTAEVHSRATARVTADTVERMLLRLPFPVQAIQVDGGSEFMAEFESFCQGRGIRLFVLPPHSPKLNGCVERVQRTHAEEFYQCWDLRPTVESMSRGLANWEVIYNTVRPHQALGLRTPKEFLEQRFPSLFAGAGSK